MIRNKCDADVRSRALGEYVIQVLIVSSSGGNDCHINSEVAQLLTGDQRCSHPDTLLPTVSGCKNDFAFTTLFVVKHGNWTQPKFRRARKCSKDSPPH